MELVCAEPVRELVHRKDEGNGVIRATSIFPYNMQSQTGIRGMASV